MESPSGLVNLYKPVGWTSAQYVYRLRRIFGVRKVGHAGSLDPFAEGVVVACVGRATRLFELLQNAPKHYETGLRLGVTNETFDTERPFEAVAGATPPTREAVERAVAGMVGEIAQVPPAFSAVKIGGVSSYRLAKSGKKPVSAARTVRIDRLEVLEYVWPVLRLEIRCGRGTYIRAVARDLGERLGCGACCETLLRRAVGPWRMEEAVHLDQASPEAVRSALIPLESARALLAGYVG